MSNHQSSSDRDDFRAEVDSLAVEADVSFFERPQPSENPVKQTYASGLVVLWQAGRPSAVEPTARRAVQLRIKRAMDIALSSLALIVLAALLVLVAIAIKLSSRGPAIFRQRREGLNGKLFFAYKFRSMDVGQGDPTGIAQTTKDDPRVTAIGRFIRKTSIDELPQLFNVLIGDMSLVGPRPHVPDMRAAGMLYRHLVPYYDCRLDMVPGITGWAQANGLRGSTANAELAIRRVDHDVAYVQNFSLWLDIKILVNTVVREFVTGNGH